MNYIDYIKPELLVIAVALYALGLIIKNTGAIKDKYIPLILTFASIALCSLYIASSEGLSLMTIFTSIVQGVIVAATAVYGNQIIKQSKK